MKRDIPILIVSAGITNLIQLFLRRHGLSKSEYPNVDILANTIHWKQSEHIHTDNDHKDELLDDQGVCDQSAGTMDDAEISHFGPLLCSFNKSDTFEYLKESYFTRRSVRGRKFVIFMGDSRTDPDTMRKVEGIEQCISIGFILPHRFNEIAIFMERYDVVIATKNASLKFVNDLLSALINEDIETSDIDGVEADVLCSEQTKYQMETDSTFTHSFSNLKAANAAANVNQ